jgi:hypothetical protein
MLATSSKVVSVSATLDGADDHPTDEARRGHAHVRRRVRGHRGVERRGGEVPEWSVQAASRTG